MTDTTEASGSCGAEAGEECRPDCIGRADAEPDGGYINLDPDGVYRVTLFGESVADYAASADGALAGALAELAGAIGAMPDTTGPVPVWLVNHVADWRAQYGRGRTGELFEVHSTDWAAQREVAGRDFAARRDGWDGDHGTCPHGAHDRSLPDDNGTDPETQQQRVAADGLAACNDCARDLFYCNVANWYFHVNPDAACFLSPSW